jgi:heme oxygenase (mycobilin-producing)
MLIRIVRMHFAAGAVEEFIKIFQNNKLAIRSFPGCTHLELLKDADEPSTFTTWSHWEDRVHLENYRKSELFAAVWKNVKPLFSKPPEAFSMEQFIQV